ncbi:MAG: alkaline phosphatase family protein [Candidatus Bathyarchaeota archaeon]
MENVKIYEITYGLLFMRVTIIGIDGLDYDIVEALELRSLQQEVCGKLSIPRECYREIGKGVYSPWTPLCWMSIVTGQVPPEELRQEKKKVYSNEGVDWIRRHFGKYLGFMRGKRKVLMKYGVELSKYKMVETPFIRDMNTIFDLTEKSIDFNIPSYSEGYTLRPFGTEAEGMEHLELFDREDKLVKKFIRSLLNRNADYDLFMAYMRAIDHYGHQKFGTRDLFNRYKLMDLFIHEIKQRVDGLLLICSDHGFQKLEGTQTGGRHSDHAFYSLSQSIDVEIDSLLDLYPLVKKALQL